MSTCSPTALYGYVVLYFRSSFGPQETKFESSTCTIKKLPDNENINLKMPSFLWQGNLSNRASRIKCLLARHDIYFSRANVKLNLGLFYTSNFGRVECNFEC
jgi:hypothetical protein